MNYWLVKTEPSTYSWEQFEKEGQTIWNGVRNFAARLHLRAMKKGDLVLWYHSNDGKDIVGIAKVIKENYPDPTATEGDWCAVDLKHHKKLKRTVTLEQVKANKQLQNMALVRIGRLSVQPVSEKEFEVIMALAETK